MKFLVTLLIATVLGMVVSTGFAQSSDQSLPTPVLTSEVNGTIAPLDLGDSRVTRHFYAFDASPGDLIITTDSKNLNGDIDVFTAVTFRPLMKTTMYANTQMPEVTKSIFLRVHQILILRVEARTPSDEAGSYHIRFRGSFEPFSGGIPVAEATESTAESPRSSRGTKRVSSVGATIAEPPAEATAKTKPTPAPVSERSASHPWHFPAFTGLVRIWPASCDPGPPTGPRPAQKPRIPKQQQKAPGKQRFRSPLLPRQQPDQRRAIHAAAHLRDRSLRPNPRRRQRLLPGRVKQSLPRNLKRLRKRLRGEGSLALEFLKQLQLPSSRLRKSLRLPLVCAWSSNRRTEPKSIGRCRRCAGSSWKVTSS